MKVKKQSDLKTTKQYKALLVGISGAHNSYCLSLYNLKSYALSDPIIRHNWSISIIQEPLITELDYTLRVKALIDNIIGHKEITVFGFSCYMWNMKYVLKICELIKETMPNAKIVLGGPEISKDWIMNGSYNQLSADFLVYGEGEKTFNSILKYLQNNGTIDTMKGLAYRENENEKWKLNDPQITFKSISEIPSPYTSGCVDDDVLLIEGVQANIETQRGCSLKCTYCIYHKDMPKIVYNDVNKVLHEIEYIVNKGCKHLRIVDANFTSDLDFTKALMRGLIERKIEATIFAELIPGYIDEEVADLFQEYNNLWDWNYITLGLGVQSINIDTLKLVKRKIKIERFDKTFELLSSRNIYAKIDIILGLPGEDKDTIAQTQEYMLSKLKDSQAHLLCCHTMRGLPGTDLFTTAEKFEMKFSSKNEPHELIESPALPRKDMVQVLRRTAIIFRIINPGFSKTYQVREDFYNAASILQCTYLTLIDDLIDIMLEQMPSNSWFVDDDFPYAETWWWESSRNEVTDEMLLEWIDSLLNSTNNIKK